MNIKIHSFSKNSLFTEICIIIIIFYIYIYIYFMGVNVKKKIMQIKSYYKVWP